MQHAEPQEPAETLERLARDAPDGAVLAAVDVSGSDSETDAEVEIIGIGRNWEEAAAAANGTVQSHGITLPPPGSEMSRLAGNPTGVSAAQAQAVLGGFTVDGVAGALTPRPATPVGVTVIADDEAVTVNSELQRLLRVPRCEDAVCTVCTVLSPQDLVALQQQCSAMRSRAVHMVPAGHPFHARNMMCMAYRNNR